MEGQLGSAKFMPISFLILTYNSSSYIYSFLDSLFEKIESGLKNDKYELIIVDNDSTDNTVRKINSYLEKKNKRNISFFRNKQNDGYAKGINFSAEHANGDILVVVNPDGELIESDFDALIDTFQVDKKLAIVGLKLVNQRGQSEKTAGKFYNPLTFLLFCMGLENVFSLRFAPDKTKEVDYVSGGFIAIKKEIFKRLDGYDKEYFMYVEDMDLCYRVKKEGFKVLYMPCAVLRHQGQGSSNRTFAIVNIYKGLQTFYTKHSSLFMQQYVKNLLSLKAAFIIFIASILGKKETVKTYQEALKHIT